jgi:hypothetical protein
MSRLSKTRYEQISVDVCTVPGLRPSESGQRHSGTDSFATLFGVITPRHEPLLSSLLSPEVRSPGMMSRGMLPANLRGGISEQAKCVERRLRD